MCPTARVAIPALELQGPGRLLWTLTSVWDVLISQDKCDIPAGEATRRPPSLSSAPRIAPVAMGKALSSPSLRRCPFLLPAKEQAGSSSHPEIHSYLIPAPLSH